MNYRIAEFVESITKYALVGILTIGTQVFLFIFLTTVMNVSGLLSYVLAVVGSLVIAYFGQSRWTFADRKSRSVTGYLLVVAGSFCVGSSGTWLIVDWAKLSPFWALPLMVIVIPLASFLMLRAWVFR